MISGRAVDIVQPDVGYIGGISRARKVAVLAEAAGIPCTPHCANDSLLQVFSLHLAAAMPACTQYQEWSIETTPWTHGVYEPALRVVDGRVDAPTAPGWGVQLDPAFVREAELHHLRCLSSRAAPTRGTRRRPVPSPGREYRGRVVRSGRVLRRSPGPPAVAGRPGCRSRRSARPRP